MKGIFINYGKSYKKDRGGISLKIKTQIQVFNKEGLNCSELVLPAKQDKISLVLYRLPFCNMSPVWKYHEEFDNADYIYMRRPYVMTYYMRKVLKKIRKVNPQVKIVIELPTYPYDEEYKKSIFWQVLMLNDKYNRVRMKGLIDYFAILTEEKEIFGIPTIKIKNGIDVAKIEPKKYVASSDGTIHMCAVAMFKHWHGYERFFNGLKTYYKNGGKRNIVCHFVGEGTELPEYRKIVKEEHLEKHIKFYGFLSGKELENIYNTSSIALSTFGMYKIGLNLSCALKTREAVARGIPMITGCLTDIFTEQDYKYYLEFPNDDSELDIQKIVDFYDKIYTEENGEDVVKNIRKYAFETIDMAKCMQNVIRFFKS